MKNKNTDFQEVQKALRLKRGEQPSPDFFENFSEHVIDRINSPQPPRRRCWSERLGFGEDWKLPLLCVLGVVICLAVAAGLLAARKMPPLEEPLGGLPNDPAAPIFTTPHLQPTSMPAGLHPVPNQTDLPDSTTPVMAPSTTADVTVQVPLSSLNQTAPSKSP